MVGQRRLVDPLTWFHGFMEWNPAVRFGDEGGTPEGLRIYDD